MMKKTKIFLLCMVFLQMLHAQTSWKPAGDKIKTAWTEKVNPSAPLPEYPRPQLQRAEWTNLNGLWDYAIAALSDNAPAKFDGKILVPFPVESSLSGVGKTVGKDKNLWYKRSFDIPLNMRNNRLMLHFGAVDWQCTVWVNGKLAGKHQGGYTPFSLDITSLLEADKPQELLVKVFDPTDEGPQPRGKQVNKPEGIWYTAVTGIWQTVWLESAPPVRITALLPTADLENSSLGIEATINEIQPGDILKIRVLDNGRSIAEITSPAEKKAVLPIRSAKLWSPDNPFLYEVKVSLLRNGRPLDEISSYAAMRKISMSPDKKGVQRLMLNNQFLFQYGVLDQGWWPDGLYTAPTEEALQYDIEQCKAMGFNLLRKHVKVEPARWYYLCDKLGMLVWQDMPSGDLGNKWITDAAQEPVDKIRTPESEEIYKSELKEMVDALRFFPCIITWVPFNEAWGQFKTEEITKWIMDYDKNRLVNCASGGNFFFTGHIHDYHHYPEPVMHRAELFGQKRAMVLGEFGGLGLPLEGHTWQSKANWGYQSFEKPDALFAEYSKFTDMIKEFIPKGLSGAIYTQVSDVEVEINGLMTYDRKVTKMPVEKLKEVNTALYKVKE